MLRSGPVTALVLQTLFVAVSLLQSHSVSACPFCAAASLTLSEQLHQSDVAVLVKWTGGEPANRDKKTFGSTNCQIVEVVQDSTGKVQVGEKLVLDTYRAGKVGDLMLLAGTKGTQQLDWSSPLNVSDEAYQYLKHVPPKGASRKERLTYCLKFLEAQLFCNQRSCLSLQTVTSNCKILMN